MNKDKEVEAYKSGNLTPEEQTKYEIAQELGILDKVLEGGWKSLSAKETGRIGGIIFLHFFLKRRRLRVPHFPAPPRAFFKHALA